jgi:hypothetical protein
MREGGGWWQYREELEPEANVSVECIGVERAMYDFEAAAIALASRVVVPEMAWLYPDFVSERWKERESMCVNDRLT